MTNRPDKDANLHSLYRQPLYQQLQTLICNYIADNDLRAGDPIPAEGDLAERFGVSRNSVREAVKSLQVLGVLDSRPGSGLFVRDFSFDPIIESLPYAILVDHRDLDDLLEVRRTLETGMAERVVQARTDLQVQLLRDIVDGWKDELAKDANAYPAHLDRSFHEVLASEAKNILVGKLLDMFWQVFYRASLQEGLVAPRDPQATFQYHVRILQALDREDAEALRAALVAHYEGIGPRVKTAAKKGFKSKERRTRA